MHLSNSTIQSRLSLIQPDCQKGLTADNNASECAVGHAVMLW